MRLVQLAACVAGAALTAASGTARADVMTVLDDQWPAVPAGPMLSLDDQICDRFSDFGNSLGARLDDVSHDLVAMRFDLRSQRAWLRIRGGGDYLKFAMDTSWYFADGMARVSTHLDLTVGSHELFVDLPAVEMVPSSYNGERYVEWRLPLLDRRF